MIFGVTGQVQELDGDISWNRNGFCPKHPPGRQVESKTLRCRTTPGAVWCFGGVLWCFSQAKSLQNREIIGCYLENQLFHHCKVVEFVDAKVFVRES